MLKSSKSPYDLSQEDLWFDEWKIAGPKIILSINITHDFGKMNETH